MVTQDEQEAELYRDQKMGVLVVTFKQYVEQFWAGHHAILYASLSQERRQTVQWLPALGSAGERTEVGSVSVSAVASTSVASTLSQKPLSLAAGTT